MAFRGSKACGRWEHGKEAKSQQVRVEGGRSGLCRARCTIWIPTHRRFDCLAVPLSESLKYVLLEVLLLFPGRSEDAEAQRT